MQITTLPIEVKEDMFEIWGERLGCDMMQQVSAFSSLVTLFAVIFIGKSWVRIACLYTCLDIVADHVKSVWTACH